MTEQAARDTKSARTRRRVVDAAAHVLLRRGYAGTRPTVTADLHALLKLAEAEGFFSLPTEITGNKIGRASCRERV